MRKALAGLFAMLALTVLMVPLVSGNVVEGPTSLEVWTEIYSVEVGDSFTVCGKIYIKNDPEYPAYIPEVWGCVEAKSGRDGWTILARMMLIDYDSLMIGPGETEEIMFRITFTNFWKAYRNVVLVRLLNHPTGERWFHYRESFEVPEH